MVCNPIKHIACAKLTEGNYVASGLMDYKVDCTNLSGARRKGVVGSVAPAVAFPHTPKP